MPVILPGDPEAIPAISVIVPAHNEASYIRGCLESIRASAAPLTQQVEMIVCLNRCTDQTEEIARELGATVVSESQKNLARIRNTGVEASRGKIIVTIDADSQMSDAMLTEVVRQLDDERVLGGGVRIKMERMSPGIFCTLLMILPIMLRDRVSAGMFWCHRKDFMALGGFDERLHSAEDLDFARRLKARAKKSGRRFRTIYKAFITTSCRKWDQFGDWYMVKNPRLVFELMGGRNRKAAEDFYYDVGR